MKYTKGVIYMARESFTGKYIYLFDGAPSLTKDGMYYVDNAITGHKCIASLKSYDVTADELMEQETVTRLLPIPDGMTNKDAVRYLTHGEKMQGILKALIAMEVVRNEKIPHGWGDVIKECLALMEGK